MRQIVIDTETTGLEVQRGHRVVEIGAVELLDRRPSGRKQHHYLNPERTMDSGAREVHGLSDEFLAGKPRFADIATELADFLDGAELLAHNAAFDLGFLDAEFERAGFGRGFLAGRCRVLDTLALAREKYPGQRNGLDALCRRLGIDNSHRELHGALLDANLLVEVYLALTSGQGQFGFLAAGPRPAAAAVRRAPLELRPRVQMARPEEVERHLQRLAAIDAKSDGACLWRILQHEDTAAADAEGLAAG